MKTLLCLLLGKLLFIANRGKYTKEFRDSFYIAKKRCLKRFGSHDGYDIQVIPATTCQICDHGTYKGRYFNWDEEYWSECRNCKGLVQVPERKIALERMHLGSHIFHQPAEHVDVTSIIPVSNVDGYVNRPNDSKYKFDCVLILMFFFHRIAFRYYWKRKESISQTNTPITFLFNLRKIYRWRIVYFFKYRITDRIKLSLGLANDDLPF
jgi:hypothetical protein